MADFLRTALDEFAVMMEEGGFVMPFLLAAGILLWLGIGYRLVMLRRGSAASVRTLVNRGWRGDLGEPAGFVDAAAAIATRVARPAPRHARRILDDELFLIEERLGRYRTLVRTIVVVAPLAGLLGTVSGMIEMFRSLGDQTFFSQSGGVANGISQALLTTQFGLVVAIPGMIVGRLLDRREHQIRQDIEQVKELVISPETQEASA